MFRLVWAASIHIHTVLRWVPTNLLLNRLRTRRGLKWGIPAMLIAVAYLLAAASCTQLMKNGGPGWLNLLVVLSIWNAFKFLWIGPMSLIRLLNDLIKERRARDMGTVRPPTQPVWKRHGSRGRSSPTPPWPTRARTKTACVDDTSSVGDSERVSQRAANASGS